MWWTPKHAQRQRALRPRLREHEERVSRSPGLRQTRGRPSLLSYCYSYNNYYYLLQPGGKGKPRRGGYVPVSTEGSRGFPSKHSKRLPAASHEAAYIPLLFFGGW